MDRETFDVDDIDLCIYWIASLVRCLEQNLAIGYSVGGNTLTQQMEVDEVPPDMQPDLVSIIRNLRFYDYDGLLDCYTHRKTKQ